MFYKQFLLNMFDVTDKFRPWLLKYRLITPTELKIVSFMVELCQFIVFCFSDTRYSNCVNTMMNVVNAFFFCVFILNSPHLSKIRCRDSFYDVHLLEYRAQIHSSISGNNAVVSTLAARETIGNICHSETLVFATPIVTFQCEQMASTYLDVFFFFRGCSTRAYFPNLLVKVFIFFFPFIYALHYFVVSR